MPWWRRETLHERLAREGGLILERRLSEPERPPWDKVGIHGVARPRRWDAVLTVVAPDIPGNELQFVVLSDGTILLEGDGPENANLLAPLVEAVDAEADSPYRAEAVRRTEDVWAVAARTIEVAELPPGTPGETVTISVQHGRHTTAVDGQEWRASFPAVEQFASERGLEDYVLEASRLDGDLWEVRVSPL